MLITRKFDMLSNAGDFKGTAELSASTSTMQNDDRAYRMENMGALTDVSDELAGARASAFGAAADSFASFD